MRFIQLVGNGFAALGRDLLSLQILGCLLIVGLSAVNVSAQTVYKSVDGEGNVAFTDRPPLLQKNGAAPLDVVPLKIKLTDRELIAANRTSRKADERANGVASDIRAKHDAEDAAAQAEKVAFRARTCEAAKARLTKYAQAQRLFRQGEDGERSYLSDQEIDTERANAVKAIDEWCSS